MAAVAANGVIGRDGDLPWRIPGDLPRVRRMTTGHVLLMGRRTYDSIGRPLPERTTVVVTRQPGWAVTGVHVAHDVESGLALARSLGDEVFVFGGADLYAATLDVADRLEITHVHDPYEGDRRFPDVDWSAWRETARDDHAWWSYVTYERR